MSDPSRTRSSGETPRTSSFAARRLFFMTSVIDQVKTMPTLAESEGGRVGSSSALTVDTPYAHEDELECEHNSQDDGTRPVCWSPSVLEDLCADGITEAVLKEYK